MDAGDADLSKGDNVSIPLIDAAADDEAINDEHVGRTSTATEAQVKSNQAQHPDGINVTLDTQQVISVQPVQFCPPGLECLLETSQVVVHLDNLRHNKVFNEDAIERMEIIDETRRVLFYAERESNPESSKSFLYHIYGTNGEEVIQVLNPLSETCVCCKASWHRLRRCKFQTTVFSPPGIISGFVRQGHTLFVQEFEILSPGEDVLLVLRGAPTDLEIYTPDFEDELGRLCVHGWHGIMHEVRRSSKDYGLTFPLDLDVRVKAILIGALFSTHWLYTTKGGRI